MAEANFIPDSVPRSPTSGNPAMVVINHANQINVIKLTDDNFLLWNLQILAGIRGLGLEVFILPEPPIPAATVQDSTGMELLNPNFVSWCRQDQLLFSYILASMTESIQGQMIGCLTSTQLWSRLTVLFSSQSKAKVLRYKLQLQTLKKDNLSMKDYLNKIKGLFDTLAACGHLLSDDDQILHVLGGVGLEYDSVVVHVTSQVSSLNFSEVSALLLSHEVRIDSYTNPADHSVANVSMFHSSHNTGSQPTLSSSQSRGRGRGRNFRGGRRGWNPNSRRPTCQICGNHGHVAEKCYYRFDSEFVPSYRRNNTAPYAIHHRT